jgi:hypothetical protein
MKGIFIYWLHMFPVHVLHANHFFISTSKIMKSSFIVKIYKSTIKAEEFLCKFFFLWKTIWTFRYPWLLRGIYSLLLSIILAFGFKINGQKLKRMFSLSNWVNNQSSFRLRGLNFNLILQSRISSKHSMHARFSL